MNDRGGTVKSREIQRALLAEMAGDWMTARRHFLAAAHLELVLAQDYQEAGAEDDLVLRSRLSAASCFWRAGQIDQAQALLNAMSQACPEKVETIQQVHADLQHTDSGDAY